MPDLERFREKVGQHCRKREITQAFLASQIPLSTQEFNRRLHGRSPLTCGYVRRIVRAMAECEAITYRSEAQELLDLMECEGFRQPEWASDPLKKLRPDPSHVQSSPQQAFQRDQQTQPGEMTASLVRRKYLNMVAEQYSMLTLPIGKANDFSFRDVFQPLKMRRDSLTAEDLVRSDRRALLDEPTRGENDPRRAWSESEELRPHENRPKDPPLVIARNSAEALEKSPDGKMIVLGSPGSGKTTILKELVGDATQRAKNNSAAPIPIFISLPELVESGSSWTLQSYFSILVGNLGIEVGYAETLWREVQQGNAFICLDSLDEVAPGQRRRVVDAINNLASIQGNSLIMSSRFYEYKSGQFRRGQFTEWELQPLTAQLRRELAQRLLPEIYKHLHSAQTYPTRLPSSFVKALERHPRASTWGKNPMLLSLAALVFVANGTLPSSRATLYKEVINAVLKSRLKDPMRQTRVYLVASSLALELHLQKKRIFTREMLHHLLAEIRQRQAENWSTNEVAQDLIDSGLLDVVAEETYGYLHQTYQEYLAAVELAQRFVSPDMTSRNWAWGLAWEKRMYSRWNEVLRLLVGVLVHTYVDEGDRRALSWLQMVIAQRTGEEGDVGDLALTLVLSSLSEVGERRARWKKKEWTLLEERATDAWCDTLIGAASRQQRTLRERLLSLADDVSHLSPSIVPTVVKRLLAYPSDGDRYARETILQALGKLGKYAPVDYMFNALQDSHADIRHAAAHALANLDEYVPTRAALKALRSKKSRIREAAVLMVGELRRQDLLEDLLRRLNDTDWAVREAAVRAVGQVENQVPLDRLIERLNDENSLVRIAAIETLGTLGVSMPVGPLQAMLDDPDDSVRATVIELLGERASLEKLIDEIVEGERHMAYAANSNAYRAALDVLSQLTERSALVEPTKTDIGDDRVLDATMQSIYLRKILPVLEASRKESSREELIEALYDTDEEHSKAAVFLLGRLQEWTAITAFFTSLRSSTHGYLRAIALSLLRRIGENVPATVFVAAMNDRYSQTRLEAVRALEGLKEQLPQEPLAVVALLDDLRRAIRAAALRVLSKLADDVPIDLPLLEKLLRVRQSEYASLNDPANRCLERLGKRVTANQMSLLFNHEEGALRADAIRIFGKYASADQLEPLLQDRDAEVRTVTVHALGEQSGTLPVHLLKKALYDEDGMVASTSLMELHKHGQWEALSDCYDEDGVLTLPPIKKERSWVSGNNVERHDKIEQDAILSLLIRTDLDDPEHISASDETAEEMRTIKVESYKEIFSRDQLIVALDDENSEERELAIYALGADAPKDRLLLALHDDAGSVRRAAVQVLDEDVPLAQLLLLLQDTYDFVREAALQVIKKMRQHLPAPFFERLIEALESSNAAMRASAIRALAERVPVERLKAAIGDSEEEVRLAAIDVLHQTHPELLPVILADLVAFVTGNGSGEMLASAARSCIADVIMSLEEAPKVLLEGEIIPLLDWGYWEVQVKAAQALGKHYRALPEEAVNRLLRLRDLSASKTVQLAANDALAEILAFEGGFEED